MENNNVIEMENTINQEQLDQIAKIMEENKSEKNKELQDIIAAPAKQEGMKEYMANVTIDNESGLAKLSPLEEKTVQGIDEVLSEEDLEVDFDSESAFKTVCETFGTTEIGEVTEVIKLLKEYKENPDGKYFSKLPGTFKSMALSLMKAGKGVSFDEAARDVLSLASTSIKQDQAIVDFNESIVKAYGELNTMSMYGKYLKDVIEVNMLKGAEQLEAEGKTEAAAKNREIANAFIDSYTLKPLFDFVENNKTFVRKIGKKELPRIDRWVRDFNYKYANERKLKMKNIWLMINPIMRAKESSLLITEVQKILIVFAKMCQNYKPSNIGEHTFMFYFLHHAVSLDFLSVEDDIYKEFTSNIVKLAKRIEEIEEEK